MSDKYNAPPSELFAARGAVTASAGLVVSGRAVYVPTAGNLAVVMLADAATLTETTFQSVPAGTILPIAIVKMGAAAPPVGTLVLQ